MIKKMIPQNVHGIFDELYMLNPFSKFVFSLDILEHLWKVSTAGIDMWADNEVKEAGGLGGFYLFIVEAESRRDYFDQELRFFLIMGIWAVVEDQIRRLAKFIHLKNPQAPIHHVARYLEQVLALRLSSLPEFSLIDDSRIIANCYKHNAGTANIEWIKKHGGPKGHVLMASFEIHGWDAYELRPDPAKFVEAAKKFLGYLRLEWALWQARQVSKTNKIKEERFTDVLSWLKENGAHEGWWD